MLREPLIDKLASLKLGGMLEGLREQMENPQYRNRYKRSSTILATQIPVAEWLERMADPTLSDAVMDRIVHNAYRLELKGESMRKTRSLLTHAGHPEVK